MQRPFASVLLGVAVIAVGCGGAKKKSSQPASGGSTVKTIAISEKEFSLTPSNVTVSKTGKYVFKATNNGKITHALEITGNGVTQKMGNISPGQSATLTVDLSKNGSYAMFCPIDGHRSQGMNGSITVGGTSGGGGGTTTGQTSTGSGYGGY